MRFFLGRSATGMKFQYSIVFLQKAKNNYGKTEVLEMRGIVSRTSCMRSELSTI